MADLIRADERATWPKIPVIHVTTRIGRTLDRILHAFEVDEAPWLRTAPQTDAARKTEALAAKQKQKRKVPSKRSKPWLYTG